MNEDTYQMIPANLPVVNKMNWQNIILMVGLTLLFLFLCYFFYKFVSHTNKRFKMVENAINQMNDRMKEKQVVQGNPFQHLFVPPVPQPPMVHPNAHVPIHPAQAKPQPPIVADVVVDTKVLDKELSEELKELDVSVEKHDEPEGRVDVVQDNKEPQTE
jgi:hypothetical protein